MASDTPQLPFYARSFHRIVVLTGAGISAESGLKTFRDNDGLWEGQNIEDVATPQAFSANPSRVYAFYNQRRQQLISHAKPNRAHHALAEFEHTFDGTLTLITQNVDNLHEIAGSKHVIHMHGELTKARCNHCQTVSVWLQDLDQTSRCTTCQQKGQMRPHIVWFGEIPLEMTAIEHALAQCDMFVAIGTSGNVYPATGFVEIARNYGAQTIELNLEPSQGARRFEYACYGKAGTLVPRFFDMN